MTTSRPIILTEYRTRMLSETELPSEIGKVLWRDFGQQVAVEPPSFQNGHHWRLTSQGWVGHIPLTPDFHFALQPKVELGNLFRMLEYAYNLKSFKFLAGLVDCHSLAEFYERLATVLARRVLDRGRQGFYRAYLAEADRLPYVRGRLDMRQSLRQPGQVKLACHYEEYTADISDNQILAWTLQRIACSGMCTERVLPTVRRAYRAVQGFVTPQPYGPEACVGRQYHRLNEDYRPLHALCRFFLEQSGPAHQLGQRTILPFLVDMARLYERFVAEWLKAHLPPQYKINFQERVDLSRTISLHFDIDLVLYETTSGIARCVLDTKYKAPEKPSNEDIYQVVAYAKAKKCLEAILVYPTPFHEPFDIMWDDIRVRSLTFLLAGDLDQAGQAFLQDLGVGLDDQ